MKGKTTSAPRAKAPEAASQFMMLWQEPLFHDHNGITLTPTNHSVDTLCGRVRLAEDRFIVGSVSFPYAAGYTCSSRPYAQTGDSPCGSVMDKVWSSVRAMSRAKSTKHMLNQWIMFVGVRRSS